MNRDAYDFSEYQPSAYEKYQYVRSGKKDISFNYFENEVRFTDNTEMMIEVDYEKEDFEMYDLLRADGQADEFFPDESEKDQSIRLESLEKETALIKKMTEKYHLDRLDADLAMERFYEEHPEERWHPLNNIFSGGNINLKTGEGILDFIYADFSTPLKENITFFRALEAVANDMQKEKKRVPSDIAKQKISNINQLILEDYYDFSFHFSIIEDIAYASLYSAICPPLIGRSAKSNAEILKQYASFLLNLQKEYLEIVEFCFDDDFYPELFSELTPAERYALYRNILGLPSRIDRKEVLRVSGYMSGSEKPYGMDEHSFIRKISSNLDRDPAMYKDFADKYGISAEEVKEILALPRFLSTYYEFGSVDEILELELSKMFECNIRFRKCKRCGKYFIMKGNYNTNYCDRVAAGQTRTCQELAAIDNYKQKTADNEAIRLYNKYYKRYHARVRVRQIKEKDFAKWKREAMVKRDQCIDGKLDIREFAEWMEGSFPNRRSAKASG